jgi:hypothetical protein
MPAFLYDYCRIENHSPVQVGGGIMLPTDRQTQAHLLCCDCEDLLNKGGEKWISGKLATWERSFPFYDCLTSVRPLFDEDGMAVYLGAQNSKIGVKQLTHFALGIFWKASVHSWKKDSRDPQIDLGPYSDEIRKWLSKAGQFPTHLHLTVVVEKPETAQITINSPYEGIRKYSWRSYFFHVPGILFMMSLGKTVDENTRAIAITSAGNPINISQRLTNSFQSLMVETVRNSRKTRALLQAKAKVDARIARAATKP